jgi:hypothetical protein
VPCGTGRIDEGLKELKRCGAHARITPQVLGVIKRQVDFAVKWVDAFYFPVGRWVSVA